MISSFFVEPTEQNSIELKTSVSETPAVKPLTDSEHDRVSSLGAKCLQENPGVVTEIMSCMERLGLCSFAL